MGFNSFIFVAFFALVYAGYLAAHKRAKVQNTLLLGASYVFYGFWDWRFCSLLAISTLVDFFVGGAIPKVQNPTKEKLLLGISICVNLLILGFFKYFNFFAESAADLLALVGMKGTFTTLRIVLPVGISFYTFQSMSYTIDVYRRRLPATNNPIDFALYVSFFPQLVAGPIERAANLLPQIARPRNITPERVESALFLILWGYLKKMAIADNLSPIVEQVFKPNGTDHGLSILVGIAAFTIQIYCDFSGYSDIARGLSRLMGFELMVNFRLPYFARNPRDFWARWHISLSTWLRDYLYIPLGGSRGKTTATYRNLMVTMILGGLWHGASWHFVLWGFYHGCLLVAHRVLEQHFGSKTAPMPNRLGRIWRMGLTLVAVMGGWLLFRVESMGQALHLLGRIDVAATPHGLTSAVDLVFYSWPLLVMQVFQHVSGDLLIATKAKPIFKPFVYGGLLVWLIVYSVHETTQFIYFQF